MTTLLKLKRDLEKFLWEYPELATATVYTAEDAEGNSFRKIEDTELLQVFVQTNYFGNLPYTFEDFEDEHFQSDPLEEGWEKVLILN